MLPRLTSQADESEPLHRAEFAFTHHRVTLEVFAAPPQRSSAQRWIALKRLARLPMPSPHRRAVTALVANL
jgi:adenine-specific DNA glycosylase